MPIVASDLKIYLSGGTANSDPDASLGGIISTTEVDTVTTLNNLFDDVDSAESTSGESEYRCIYLKNNHGSLTLQNASVYLVSQTPSTDTFILVGFEPGAVDLTAQTIVDENTPPTGVTYESGIGANNKITVSGGDLAPGEVQALWLQRSVSPGASAYASDTVVIRFLGDTLP